MNEGKKSWPPGAMNLAGNSSNPIAARKKGGARRERRHVRVAVTRQAQLHIRTKSAARGDVLEVRGKTPQNATIPTRPAARSTAASRIIPNGLSGIAPIQSNRRASSLVRQGRRERVDLLEHFPRLADDEMMGAREFHHERLVNRDNTSTTYRPASPRSTRPHPRHLVALSF
jgi:hypothetical protein